MQPSRAWVTGGCIALLLASCGGKGEERDADASQRTAVLNTIDNFYLAFTRAQPTKACRLLTPKLRRAFMKAAIKAVPSLHGKPCPPVFLGFYERVPPENAPRAITLAAEPEYPTIKLDGDKATASYKDGGVTRLERLHGKWLIAQAALLPTPSVGQHR